MPIETIVITENPVSSWEQYEQTIVRGKNFEAESHTHRDMGGFWQATFEYIPQDREDALSFLNNALGRSVVFYNEDGNIDWEGFINTVTLSTGTASIKNTLNDLANKVWVRYTPVGGGAVTRSTVMEDAVSQGRYGIKEQVIAGGEISSTVADQIAQLYLDSHYWPFPQLQSIDLSGTPKAHPGISVVCYGWFRTLEWRVYNQTVDAGTQNAGQQITDMIGIPTYTPGSLKTALEGWWTLDEYSDGSGAVTREEASGSGLDLADTNTTASADGKVNRGADFELTNAELLSRASSAALQTGDIDFTIACWIKFETVATSQHIMGKWGAVGAYEYVLYYDTGGNRLRFYVSRDGTNLANEPADVLGAPAAGTWYFVVCWHDSVANTINIQVNDAAVDSLAHATGVFATATPFAIGGWNVTGNVDGVVDEAAFWKRVLTTAERTALYNLGFGVSYRNLGGSSLVGGVAPFMKSATIEANPTSVTKEYDADRKMADICTSIADLGNDKYRAFIAGCEEDRAFYYKEAAPPVRIEE